MFNVAVLRIDNSVLVDNAEIQGQRAARGSGDGNIWRGVFSVPPSQLRPTIGETIQLRLSDGSIPAVVTDVAGDRVHFRVKGRMPDCVAS